MKLSKKDLKPVSHQVYNQVWNQMRNKINETI